jgi:hypothetical protein
MDGLRSKRSIREVIVSYRIGGPIIFRGSSTEEALLELPASQEEEPWSAAADHCERRYKR